MGVFTFVCRNSGGQWNAKQIGESGDLEASASDVNSLQRNLVHAALGKDSSGGVQSSFSMVTPSSAVFQVVIGGGCGGGFIGGGGASAPAASGGGSAPAEEKKEEKKEEEKEESDDDMGFSLFD